MPRAMGIDPAGGSSAFGIAITHLVDGAIQVLYSEEFKRPDYNEMLNTVYGLIRKYNIKKLEQLNRQKMAYPLLYMDPQTILSLYFFS
jgi:hypothetical protein